ncbi:hypothetical protein [Salinibacter sp. 10B]|uniref:hypothetical protein n=1 Tax=Salinibacter sp. 10B TaxID=1923971 RepID=UPI0015E3DF59|nr:hypothetical protein [Salinibacter sp. 10B]
MSFHTHPENVRERKRVQLNQQIGPDGLLAGPSGAIVADGCSPGSGPQREPRRG